MRSGLLAGALIAAALGMLGGATAAAPADSGLGDFILRPQASPRRAEPPRPAPPQATATTRDSGLPALSIRGWNQAHGRASIQIALVLDKTEDPAMLMPLAIDGSTALTTWKHEINMLNQPIQGAPGQIRKTSLELMEFGNQKLLRILGQDNSLKKPAAFGIEESGLRLVFFVLDAWTDAHGDFRLGLQDIDRAAEKYAQPGRLRVWLLDDEKPIWSDTVAWPGKQEKLPMAKPVESVPPKTEVAPPRVSSGMAPAMPVMPTVPDAPATHPAPLWPANPASSAIPPSNSRPPQPASPPAPVDVKEMTIDQLVDHIEKTWGAQMSPRVRREWQGGTFYFYKTQNPTADRMNVFVRVVKDCFWETPAGDLHDALSLLYVKLKQRQPVAERQ